jgi:hypothetical protein
MPNVDIHATIEQAKFPPSVWEYLDLLGEILFSTQTVIQHYDENSLACTDHQKLIVMSINRDITTLISIYILLRCELLHQAAAHVRLFCESVITHRFIERDVINRVPQFSDYAGIEAYELAKNALEWEEGRASIAHAEKVRGLLTRLKPEYETLKPRYSFTDKSGRTRPFTNWCNTPIARQAAECGAHIKRLYSLVYSQLSSYVHGSAWSLRRQISYSKKHYDKDVVLSDIATIIRTTSVVWEEWAKFCDEQLGCSLADHLPSLSSKLDSLDLKYFGVDK